MKVGVVGARGRMGRTVLEALGEASDCDLVAAIDIGDDIGLLNTAEVIVDFTIAEAVMPTIEYCIGQGIHCVVGTTGFDEVRLEQVRVWCAKQLKVGVLVAPNFSIGAVLMMRFAEEAASYFDSVEIIELHHPDKEDAPSGTSRHTAQAIARARAVAGVGRSPDATKDETPGARGAMVDDIRIHSVRARGLVAHQEVLFGGVGETLTIRHDSLGRSSFMPGVLLATRRVHEHPGLTVGLASYL